MSLVATQDPILPEAGNENDLGEQRTHAVRNPRIRLLLSRSSGSLGEARLRVRDARLQPNAATSSRQGGRPITVRSDASPAASARRSQRSAIETGSRDGPSGPIALQKRPVVDPVSDAWVRETQRGVRHCL